MNVILTYFCNGNSLTVRIRSTGNKASDSCVFCVQMMCKLLYFVQSLNYICSVVILTVISLERYVAINHPILNRRFARTRTVRGAVAAAVWTISVLYSLPHLVAYDTVYVQRPPSNDASAATTAAAVVDADVFCFNTRPVVTRVYIFVNFVALYVTPLTLMTFVYARISIKLWQSGSQTVDAAAGRLSVEARRTRTARGGSLRNPSCLTSSASAQPPEPRSAPNPHCAVRWTTAAAAEPTAIEVVVAETRGEPVGDGIVHERSPFCRRKLDATAAAANRPTPAFTQHNPLRSRRKVIRLLIAFVVSFAVCMLPNHVWLLWQQWADLQLYSYEQYARHMYVPPVMTLLFYVNSCLNPFLYALISDKFRSAVAESECFRRCCCQHRRAADIRFVVKSAPPAPLAPPDEDSS